MTRLYGAGSKTRRVRYRSQTDASRTAPYVFTYAHGCTNVAVMPHDE
ncbi:hypothetical protein HMPREF0591_3724 [Mycobacterium parascrofulaceum ATCC BAA-614]|uniref:Uncharacterized protein n=1 Tax=Mycobacterium parascrofulaceum ATCC BAA-614 TaxID=525368 RepID=D5PC30_9MYCO|nr:hypothetical protein HMPREF0591_3724 [Mycobacterium parascrofulaceum ATCC BAA-614]